MVKQEIEEKPYVHELHVEENAPLVRTCKLNNPHNPISKETDRVVFR